MPRDERTARLIDRTLGFLALLAFCGALLLACACTPDRSYCNEPMPSATGR